MECNCHFPINLVLNQSEKGNYSSNYIWFGKIQNWFLCDRFAVLGPLNQLVEYSFIVDNKICLINLRKSLFFPAKSAYEISRSNNLFFRLINFFLDQTKDVRSNNFILVSFRTERLIIVLTISSQLERNRKFISLGTAEQREADYTRFCIRFYFH